MITNKDLLIARLIRQRYTMRQILHIVANKDKEPQAYKDYAAYRDECRTKVTEQMAREQEKAAQLAAEKAAAESASEPTTE